MARRKAKPQIIDGQISYRLRGDALDVKIYQSTAFPGTNPCNSDVYAPAEKQLVPQDGAWAMITRELPPMELTLDEHVTIGRVFYLEHCSNADREGFLPDGSYKVLTHSPWGDVWLWPYEYTVIRPEVIIDLWTHGGLVFHPINVQSSTLNAIVFYARSRGISLHDATVMALGTMKGPVGWFDPTDDVREFVSGFQNIGVLTPENRRRRAAAKRARRREKRAAP